MSLKNTHECKRTMKLRSFIPHSKLAPTHSLIRGSNNALIFLEHSPDPMQQQIHLTEAD